MITKLVIDADEVHNGTIIQKKNNLYFISIEKQWIHFIPDRSVVEFANNFKIVIDEKFVLIYENNKLKNSWLNYQKIYKIFSKNNYFLIKLSKYNYVRIYQKIYKFSTDQEIIDYQIKNDKIDFCISEKGNYYFPGGKIKYIDNSCSENYFDEDCVIF